MTGRILDTEADLAEGAAWLRSADPRLAPALALPLPLRRRPGGYRALLWAITGQQLSTASAAACWARIEAAGFDAPTRVAAASEEALRAAGFSRQKARYAKALAAAEIDYDRLAARPDAEVEAILTAVPGIGRWTAEIYLAFSLGRADVLPAGDLALQAATRQLFGLDARPDERGMRAIAAAWSPWRGVAARALWAYYRVVTNREGTR
ncbi:MAG: DNA-3-methyladenine glycosylase 2 family protein [Maritimibacter sp.]|nr:DNA-3-methyladenine glycosylase 2 family protein [Maritimibacter sp.]